MRTSIEPKEIVKMAEAHRTRISKDHDLAGLRAYRFHLRTYPRWRRWIGLRPAGLDEWRYTQSKDRLCYWCWAVAEVCDNLETAAALGYPVSLDTHEILELLTTHKDFYGNPIGED